MQTSFAWGASLSPLCLGHEDTLPPVASIFGDCNMTKLTFTDSQANASKIIGYVVDSLLNLRLDFDPLFIPGNLQTSFFYELRLNDASKSGRARIRVIDRFGNVTTVTSSIAARPNPKTVPTSIEIPFAAASIPNFREVELANTTITPLVLTGPTGLRFANGTQGFALVSPDMSDLARDSVRTFLVSYVAPDAQLRRDTIVYGGECTFVRIPLESKDVGPITGTTGVDFGCLTVGTSREDVVLVHNNGLYELTVTSMTFDDAAHFTVISPPLPFILAPGKRLAVTVRYSPDAVDTNCTTAHIATKEVGELTAQVCGCGLPQSSVRIEASSTKKELLNALKSREFAWLAPVPSPADRGESVRFIFGLAHSAQVSLDLFDVEGRQVHSITPAGFPSGTHEMLLDTRNLATGSYVYKYTANGVEYTGKVTIR